MPHDTPDLFAGKVCSKCGQWKLYSEYYNDKRAHDGKASQCRICNLGYRHKNPGKNSHIRDIPPEPEGMRWCTSCKQMRPLEDFAFQQTKNRLRRQCTPCKNAEGVEYNKRTGAKKRYYWLNREKMLAAHKQYRNSPETHHQYIQTQRHSYRQRMQRDPDYEKRHYRKYKTENPEYAREMARIRESRRRARKRALPDTFTIEDWQAALDYFGGCAICGSPDNLHADHWIALKLPDCPGTIPSNIVPLCADCHKTKGTKYPQDWLAERPEIYQKIKQFLHDR